MTEKTQDISRDLIVPNRDNPRPAIHFKKTNPKMVELTNSIAATGLLQPIVVRKHPKQPGKFELVFGERRFHACGHAGMDSVTAFVREYSDEETFANLIAENIQREDPCPIMEARAVAAYQARGKSLADIANRFGKSPGWAVRRSLIAKLSDGWQEAIAEEKIDWSIEHYLRIARYTVEIQDELLTHYVTKHSHGWEMSLSTLDAHLGDLMRDAGRTPWKADDADLVPEAGACSACPKRTSCQGALFPELEAEKKPKNGVPDRCTDHHCWDRKAQAHLDVKRVALKEKHPNLVELSESYKVTGKVLSRHNVDTCKKSDPGAMPAITIDGDRIGSMTWVRPSTIHRYGGRQPVVKITDRPLTVEEQTAQLAAKREGLQKRRTLMAWSALADVLKAIKPVEYFGSADSHEEVDDEEEIVLLDDTPEAPVAGDAEGAADRDQGLTLPTGAIPRYEDLVAWAVLYGVGHAPYWAKNKSVQYFTELSGNLEHRELALWDACHDTMVEAIQGCIAHRRMDAAEPAILARMIRVDLAALVQQAAEAIHEPKAWRSQYPDFYKEAA